MRAVVFLSVLGLAAAGGLSAEKQGSCLVDGAEAVSDLMDGAMFVWASIARCGHTGEAIKCEVAVASAISSVNSMINVILKAVDKCHGLKTEHKKCGMAASSLSKGIAGLAAAAGGIIQKCPGLSGNAGNGSHGNNFAHADAVMCTVNLKSTAKSLFKAIKALLHLKKSKHDVDNSLKIVGAFAGLGQYLSGALGHCTHSLNEDNLGCAQHVNMLIKDLTKVAEGGVALSKSCEGLGEVGKVDLPDVDVNLPDVPALPGSEVPEVVEIQTPRLYEDDSEGAKHDGSILPMSPNLMLAAFLPVTAIVGFVGGRIFGGRRSRAEQTRETRAIVEQEEPANL